MAEGSGDEIPMVQVPGWRSRSFMGLLFHWGEPNHPTVTRANTGRLYIGGIPDECYVEHEIARWYGVSWRRVWWLGFMRLGRSRDFRVKGSPGDR